MGKRKEPTEVVLVSEPASYPFTEEELQEMGYVFTRRFDNGDWAGVLAGLTYGKARVCLNLSPSGYEDGFCYESLMAAVSGLAMWDPDKQSEPTGWFRHVNSGRRRPGGDASKEYVQT